jgi:hypothetical protein
MEVDDQDKHVRRTAVPVSCPGDGNYYFFYPSMPRIRKEAYIPNTAKL